MAQKHTKHRVHQMLEMEVGPFEWKNDRLHMLLYSMIYVYLFHIAYDIVQYFLRKAQDFQWLTVLQRCDLKKSCLTVTVTSNSFTKMWLQEVMFHTDQQQFYKDVTSQSHVWPCCACKGAPV